MYVCICNKAEIFTGARRAEGLDEWRLRLGTELQGPALEAELRGQGVRALGARRRGVLESVLEREPPFDSPPSESPPEERFQHFHSFTSDFRETTNSIF